MSKKSRHRVVSSAMLGEEREDPRDIEEAAQALQARMASSQSGAVLAKDDPTPPGVLDVRPKGYPVVNEDNDPTYCHSLVWDRPRVRVQLPEVLDDDGALVEGDEVLSTAQLPANYFHRRGVPRRPYSEMERAKQLVRIAKRERQWWVLDRHGKVVDQGPTLDEAIASTKGQAASSS